MDGPPDLPKPSSMVKLHGLGLRGPEEQRLNGLNAIALNDVVADESMFKDVVRVRVHILRYNGKSIIRSFLPGFLRPGTAPAPGTRLFRVYTDLLLHHAQNFLSNNECRLAEYFYEELVKTSGYTAPLEVYASYSTALCLQDKIQQGIRVLEPVVMAAEESHHSRVNHFRYDLSTAYIEAKRLDDALDVIQRINVVSGGPIITRLKKDILNDVMNLMHNQGSPREKEVCRELLALAPEHGMALWNLGGSLCREGALREGVRMYQHAVDEGTGLKEEQRARIRRNIEIGQAELNGAFRGARPLATLPDGTVVTFSPEASAGAVLMLDGKMMPLDSYLQPRKDEEDA